MNVKIEKINDNQIRCTLEREDLEERQLKITELAYGTERAKLLFRDMMEQAFEEFGFEAENIPLMIEAVPMAQGRLVLLITKVDDPEELDTRFSRFRSVEEDDSEEEPEDEAEDTNEEMPLADVLRGCLEQFGSLIQNGSDSDDESDDHPAEAKSAGKGTASRKSSAAGSKCRIFSFRSLEDVILFCRMAGETDCSSSVYKMQDNQYLLLLESEVRGELDGIASLAAEYAISYPASGGTPYYIREHGEAIVRSDAVRILSVM